MGFWSVRQGDTSPGDSPSQGTGRFPSDSAVSPWERLTFLIVCIQVASFSFLFIHFPVFGSLTMIAGACADVEVSQ